MKYIETCILSILPLIKGLVISCVFAIEYVFGWVIDCFSSLIKGSIYKELFNLEYKRPFYRLLQNIFMEGVSI